MLRILTMEDIEVWKPVVGFEDRYEVSSYGNIRSKARLQKDIRGRVLNYPSKPLKQALHRTNTWRIRFCVNGVKCSKSVHRLVAAAFIPNPLNKPEVNHKDGNRLNNRLSNLEWVTQEENIRHAVETGLINNPFGKEARHSKYKTKVWDLSGNLVATTYGHKELKDLGFDYRNVYAVLTGKQKTHRGHKFTREEK